MALGMFYRIFIAIVGALWALHCATTSSETWLHILSKSVLYAAAFFAAPVICMLQVDSSQLKRPQQGVTGPEQCLDAPAEQNAAEAAPCHLPAPSSLQGAGEVSLREWRGTKLVCNTGTQQHISPRDVFSYPHMSPASSSDDVAGMLAHPTHEEQQPPSPPTMAQPEGSVDQPSTPLFICTSSRQALCIRRPSGKVSSSGGAQAAADSPMPLPSPADSPLARRVTSERDENGYPTCPALVELLQQREQQELLACSSLEQQDSEQQPQQQVPWAGIQLRSISEQLSKDVGKPAAYSATGSRSSSGGSSSLSWFPILARRHSASSDLGHTPCQGDSADGGLSTGGFNFTVAQLVELHSAAAAAGGSSAAKQQCCLHQSCGGKPASCNESLVKPWRQASLKHSVGLY